MAVNNGINSPFPLSIAKGGTGNSSPLSNAILAGNGLNPVQSLPLLDGQLLIGRTGMVPLAANLSAGSGIFISNSSGTITISAAPLNYFVGFQSIFTSLTSMTFNPGECTSANGEQVMASISAFTKTTSQWVQGNGNGGFPASVPVSANQSYCTFIISRPDGVIDFGYDSSITANNLLATASSAGFTRYRRIGFVRTNVSANIISMQNVGDYFMYVNPITDFTATISSGNRVINLSMPTQINIVGIFFARSDSSGGSPAGYYTNPVGSSSPGNLTGSLVSPNPIGCGQTSLTNIISNGQMQLAWDKGGSPGTFTIYFTSMGWIDNRSII